MKYLDHSIIENSLRFAARWGFLTQDLFFRYFCLRSQARQYIYWKALTQKGLFLKSQARADVLILSMKGRNAVGTGAARPARLPTYIEHDSSVAEFFLLLDAHGLVVDSWLEDELVRNRLLAYRVLGTERLERMPDAVLDLHTRTGVLRCALEIEKTTKSKERYRRFARSYLDYSKVQLLLVGTGSDATKRAMAQAFEGRIFSVKQKTPMSFNFTDFRTNGLQTALQLRGQTYTLADLLPLVTKCEAS